MVRVNELPSMSLTPSMLPEGGFTDKSNFFELTQATLGYTYDPIFEAARNAVKYYDAEDPEYNALEDIDGYEQYKTTLVNAKNAEHMSDLKRGIRESIERRRIMGEHGFFANVGAGLFDPINLVALPFGGFGVGRSILQSTARVGAGVGVLAAGQEAIKYPFDPVATTAESVFNITAATVTGGVLGSLGGVALNRKAKVYEKTVAQMDETLEALGNLTADDATLVGDRASRPMGDIGDEVLESLKVSEQKRLKTLEDQIETLSEKTNKTSADYKKLGDINKGAENLKAEVKTIQRETALRRIEESRSELKDPNKIAESWFTDSFLYNRLLPTAMKSTLQSKNIPTSIKGKFVKNFGDSGITLAGHQSGLTSGNSAYQLSRIRDGEWVQILDKMVDNFAQQSGTRSKVIMDYNLNNMDGSFDDYLRQVNKKYITGEAPINDIEKEGIELFSKFWKTWEDRLKNVGLIGNEKFFARQLISKERQVVKSRSILNDLESKPSLTKNQAEYKKALQERVTRLDNEINELELNQSFAKDDGVMPQNEDVMFSRYWNPVAIAEKKDEFSNILTKWYEENPFVWVKNPSQEIGAPAWIKQELDPSPQSIQERVDQTIESIIGNPDPTSEVSSYYGNGKSKHFKHRTLDIPNRLVFDFIVNDPMTVLKAYTQRVAPRYEFAKMNGGKSLDEVLDDIDDEMFYSGKSKKDADKVRKDFIVLYDRVVGTVLRDPNSWNARVANVLRDGAQLNYLGSAGFSTFPDMAKIIMEHDGDVLIKVLKSWKDLDVRMNASEARLSGQMLEILKGSSHMRQVEDSLNNPFSNNNFDKYYTKNVDKIKNGFYTANLLAPFTRMFKYMDSMARSHTLVDLSLKRANGTINKQDLAYISRYNIDLNKAKQIKELVDTGVIQRSEKQGLFLPNTEEWPLKYASLRDEFRASLNSGIENTVLMGTPADKPTLLDGVIHVPMSLVRKIGAEKFYPEDPKVRGYHRIENPLLGLPFTFMSYSFAAMNKITAAFAHNQVKNRAVAVAAGLGLGYMSLHVKSRTSEGGKRTWDEMSLENKLARSFDASGLAALISDAYYTSLSTSRALGGPDFGAGVIQPKYLGEETKTEAIVGIAGAGPSWGYNLAYNGVGEFLQGNFGEGAKTIIKSLPYGNIWFAKDFINETTRGIENTLGEVGDYQSRMGRF